MRLSHTTVSRSALFWVGVLCLIGAMVLSFRLVHRWRRQPFPPTRQIRVEAIEDWMTLGYLSRTYNVPLDTLSADLGLAGSVQPSLSLRAVSDLQKKPVDEVIARLRESITAFQRSRPSPPQSPQ